MGWLLWVGPPVLLVLVAVVVVGYRRGSVTAAPPSDPPEPEYRGRHSRLPDGSIPQGPWRPPEPPPAPPPAEPPVRSFDTPLYPDLTAPEHPEPDEPGSALADLDSHHLVLGPADLPGLGTAHRPPLPAPRDAADDAVGEEEPVAEVPEQATPVEDADDTGGPKDGPPNKIN